MLDSRALPDATPLGAPMDGMPGQTAPAQNDPPPADTGGIYVGDGAPGTPGEGEGEAITLNLTSLIATLTTLQQPAPPEPDPTPGGTPAGSSGSGAYVTIPTNLVSSRITLGVKLTGLTATNVFVGPPANFQAGNAAYQQIFGNANLIGLAAGFGVIPPITAVLHPPHGVGTAGGPVQQTPATYTFTINQPVFSQPTGGVYLGTNQVTISVSLNFMFQSSPTPAPKPE